MSRAPGWEPDSWAYHGDDGNSFAAQNAGKVYGPPFTTGDTIGCGVNFRTGTAFFTKNGMHLGAWPSSTPPRLTPSTVSPDYRPFLNPDASLPDLGPMSLPGRSRLLVD